LRTCRTFRNACALLGVGFGLISTVGLAAPRFKGFYKGGLGTVEMSQRADRVVGYSAAGGACGFLPKRRILDAQLEGNTLVGSVLVCQTGPACPEKTYPFLGFVDVGDGTVTGEVKLDPGCQSPALNGTHLLLEPAEGLRLKVKPNPRKAASMSRDALSKAQRLLDAGDYAGAAQAFEMGLSYQDQNWPAYLGLGVAELRRGNVPRALDAMERSKEIAVAQGQDHSDIHYNLACALTRNGEARAALESLKRAVKLGFSLPETMSSEQDLRPLHEEPEFEELVKKSAAQKEKQDR
jgi:hypothetical protein